MKFDVHSFDGMRIAMFGGGGRMHAPKWWRVDRHLAWLFTSKKRRSSIVISYMEGKSIGEATVRVILGAR